MILQREELVEIVKAVLGDVNAVRESHYRVQLYRGAHSIRFTFISHGGTHLTSYLMPLPDEIIAMIEDEDSNPYNSLTVRFDSVSDVVTPPPSPTAPEGA